MSQIIIPYRGLLGQQSATPPVNSNSVSIGTGTTNDDSIPFYGLYNWGETAFIYLASSINALNSGAKNINKIQIYLQGYAPNYTYSDVEVWVGHVVQTEFPSGTTVGYSGLTITNLTKCWQNPFNANQSGATLYFCDFANVGQGGLSTFNYNGTSNLIVIFKNKDGAWTSGYGYTKRSTLTRYGMVEVHQDASYPANGTAMTRTLAVMNIELFYTY